VPLTVIAASSGNHALFVVVVLLHAAAALVGFGSIGFAGTYASRAARMAASAEWWSAASPAPERREVAGPPVVAGPGAPGSYAGPQAPEEAAPLPTEEDPEVEELLRYFRRPARFWPAVVIVPVFGVLALSVQPGGKGLNQLWSVTALLVWTVAVVVIAGVVLPGLRQVSALLDDYAHSSLDVVTGEPSGAHGVAWRARLGRAGALAGRGAAACDVLFFVALALMIWQP
jgi:hypothetical protein